MLQVIGAGFGRTGTHSLALALDTLGYGPCYTLLDVDKNPGHTELWNQAIDGRTIDWNHVFRDYRSAVEWPAVAFLSQLERRFPQARIILTLRDPESWYESAAATILPGLEATAHHPDPEIRARSGMKRRLILDGVFSGKYWDREHAIKVYQDHVTRVRRTVSPERLLLYEVTEGWGRLCEFLAVHEPDVRFPKRNQRASFIDSAPEWASKAMKSGRPNYARPGGEEPPWNE